MFKVSAGFIGNFKDGDNIKYNLEILGILYSYYSKSDNNREKQLLCKPIIILLVSIIEATIDDLFFKIENYFREGVSNIPAGMIFDVRCRTYNKFDTQICLCEKYDIFDSIATNFYTALKELQKLRNRIHIQNNKKYMPLDERYAFNEYRKESAEKICEYILKKMNKKFSRSLFFNDYVGQFEIPWSERYVR